MKIPYKWMLFTELRISKQVFRANIIKIKLIFNFIKFIMWVLLTIVEKPNIN